MVSSDTRWPELTYPKWRDTAATLQLWTQIVGKLPLVLAPWVNHSWHVTLHMTACGLGTPPIPLGPGGHPNSPTCGRGKFLQVIEV